MAATLLWLGMLASLATLGLARAPHEHPLSKLKPAIGARPRRAAGLETTLVATPNVLYGR